MGQDKEPRLRGLSRESWGVKKTRSWRKKIREWGGSEGKPKREPPRGGTCTKEAVPERVEAGLERSGDRGFVVVEKPLD